MRAMTKPALHAGLIAGAVMAAAAFLALPASAAPALPALSLPALDAGATAIEQVRWRPGWRRCHIERRCWRGRWGRLHCRPIRVCRGRW